MGTPAAAVPSLRQCLADGHEVVAVWTQPDRPSGRGNKVTPSPIKEFALANGIAVHQPTKIKTDEARALFASHQAEVVVVVAYGRILPQAFLQTPRRGCLNVHFSLLPLYRGAAPVNWAIVQGEKMTGVTTMFIEEKLDAGPILRQRETAIADHETAPELMARLAPMGAELLGETLARFDTLTPRPQHDRDASFAPLLKKEDGLIDWSGSAFVIDRCIRGFQPWPNAYTHYKSQRLIIWNAQPEALQDSPMNAGAIAAAQGDEMIVNCGEHTQLRLLEVQPESKRRMSVRDFLNGMHVSVGDRLK
jgi:methionyl-tRNA formyltransferase